MILKWVEIFPKYLPAYKAALLHPNLFVVDLAASIASCAFEIFDMLHKCFGLCDRCRELFKTFKNSINYQSAQEICAPEQMSQNGLVLSMVNQFADYQGFEKLLAFIQPGEFKCPIPLVKLAIKTFSRLQEIGLKDQFVGQTLQRVVKLVEERLLPGNLADTELKEVHLEEIKGVVRHMSTYKSLLSKEVDRHQVQEVFELELAKRYM